jgi:hypothetical protein
VAGYPDNFYASPASVSPPSAAQQLLNYLIAFGTVILISMPPWLIRAPQGRDWWIQFAPLWDAPHPLTKDLYNPYCAEGHACYFLLGMEIVALFLLRAYLHRRLSDEPPMDYGDYSPYRRQREHRRQQRGR